jgi:hypothetical protein
MKRTACATTALLATVFLCLAARAASAQEAGAKDPGYFQVALKAGESFDMCSSGEIVCPASVAICDDPKVAVPVDLPGGIGFRGVSPGTTLCSAASAVGPRRVFRITVR